jgi:hypothetical protein
VNFVLITLAAAAVGLVSLTAPVRAKRWPEVAMAGLILVLGYAVAVLAAAGVRIPNPTNLIEWISSTVLRAVEAIF